MNDTPEIKQDSENKTGSSVGTEKSHTTNKVPLIKRLKAGAFDYVIAIMIMNTFEAFVGDLPFLVQSNSELSQSVPDTIGVLSFTLAALYLLTKDCLAGDGQSPGKRLAGYKVIRTDGSPITVLDSIKRNLTVSLWEITGALELIPTLGLATSLWPGTFARLVSLTEIAVIANDAKGLRIGDRAADTKTVDCPEQIPYV